MEAFRVQPSPSSSTISSSSSFWIPPAEPAQASAPTPDCEHMFDKVLTPSDVGKLNRLVIPKQYAERFFPLDPSFTDKGLVLSFEDRTGKQWCFRYSYWNSSQSYVMTKGWSRFVKEKQLDAGDTVSFFRTRNGDAGQRRLFIDLQHRKHHYPPLPFPHFSVAGRPVAPWGGLITSTMPSMYGAADLPHGGSRLPYLYYRSVEPPPHVEVQAAAGGGDMVGVPMVLDSVPVVFGVAKPKQVRLFGVNLECSEPEGSSNSQSLPSVQPLPPCQWSIGGAESMDISTKNPQPSMYLQFGCSEKEEGRRR